MVIDFTLLGNPLFVDQPQELIGWVGWLFLLSMLIILLFRWRKLNKRWTRLHGGIFIGLLVLLFLTNLLFVVRLPDIGTIVSSDLATSLSEMAIPIFAAMPWVLAAGSTWHIPRRRLWAFFQASCLPCCIPIAHSLPWNMGCWLLCSAQLSTSVIAPGSSACCATHYFPPCCSG